MRKLTDLLGGLLAVCGVLLAMGSCAFYQTGAQGGEAVFLLGAALTGAGVIMCRAAGRKACPQCSELIKHTALKCKHCGSEVMSSS